ncbi:MAG: DHH family phosphoesterase [Clostridia bacterium]|nr:DHH family phosphoesterase [Clostridia bacterium]
MLSKIIFMAKKLKVNHIYVFAHSNPDGDAKGSCMALVKYFQLYGFDSKYILTKENSYLNGIFGEITTITDIGDERFISVICDSSNKQICENNLYERGIITYKIDHHKNSEEFADENYINSKASSTCEIVWSMMNREMITPEIATYLYTGIYTDTGGFDYSLSESVFLACADLIKRGANNVMIAKVVNSMGYHRAKMSGYILLNYTSYADGLLGIVMSYKECSKYHFTSKNVAKSVNVLKNIADVRIYFVACEDYNGSYFVELRSSESTNVDVSKIAIANGGGGHVHAAGFTAKNLKHVLAVLDMLKVL